MSARAGRNRRKPVLRRSSFRSVVTLVLLPALAFLLFLAVRFVMERLQPPPPSVKRVRLAKPVPLGPQAPAAPAPAPETRRAASGPAGLPEGPGMIALVLDDVGHDPGPLLRAMKIENNLSFSILPNALRVRECAELLHDNGFEVLCHLPMEPQNYPEHSPGANAIMTGMTDEEIARATREGIAAVPYAVGMNNHMGSRATTDQRVMRAVLASMPPGMFFIDSMTAGNSVGFRVARQMRIPTAERKVFLDDTQSEAEVRRQLVRLAQIAREDGVAVGIGHLYPVTLDVLSEEIPQLRARGFRFVRASEVVE